MNYNEQELFARIKQDDETAFTAIYNHYQPMLHLEAYHKIQQQQEAEDIVQEVFTSLWKRRADIDINTSLKGFLYKAVHFQFTTRIRKKQSNKKFLAATPFLVTDETCCQSLEKKELHLQLQMAINNLSSDTCRKVLKLTYLQQKSHKEAAAELNVQVHTIKSQASRGIKHLTRMNRRHRVLSHF
jgi:RNA polymerase sigma-70 factor (ECF subfamily)